MSASGEKAAAGDIKLRFHCPNCPAHVEVSRSTTDDSPVRCPRCGQETAVMFGGSLRGGGPVERCPVCQGAELYYRKNFPQTFGFTLVALAAVASFVFLARREMALAWAFPLAALAVDAVLYFFVGYATCCYRCKAEVAGAPRNPEHGGFDLATAEKYTV